MSPANWKTRSGVQRGASHSVCAFFKRHKLSKTRHVSRACPARASNASYKTQLTWCLDLTAAIMTGAPAPAAARINRPGSTATGS